jgi:transcriptional regulator with PAS, ATPase and Fis domain
LLRKVLTSRQGFIANNIPTDVELNVKLSLRDVQSVLCVPLTIETEIIGAIYLDTRHAGTVFETGHLQLLTAVAAVAAGALDRARRLEQLSEENARLKEEVASTSGIVGASWQADQLRALIARIAPRDLWVFIQGETGVGKDLVARELHRFSKRSNGAFVSINCSAIPEPLLESELFGTTTKAYTNAGERKGLIEEAHEGTLFLDEIGDLPLALQAKLLTVLDHGIVRRLGSNEERKVDFRLISATNKDLNKAVQEKTFRMDLFFKLHHSVIQIPPLRERPEDIEPLARHFLQRAAEKFKCNVHDFSPEALAFLNKHQWPGNVRELDFTIRSAVGVCDSDVIQTSDFSARLPLATAGAGAEIPIGPWNDAVLAARRDIIRRAMRHAGGDYNGAAKILGMHTNNLHKLITNLGMRDEIEGIRSDGKLK